MSLLAPTLQTFFTERLIAQRDSSPQTVAAYRDTFRLLLSFAHERMGKQPCELDVDDLDAPLIGAFLTHLEQDRGNRARTRNARLAAIHSLYRYMALRHPEHLQTIGRVIAIPFKRHEQNSVNYLNLDEIKALLRAPDRTTWLGRRDHALLLTAIQTGVRVTELVTLRICDVSLATGAHCRVTGKGRKRRTATLTRETVAVLIWRVVCQPARVDFCLRVGGGVMWSAGWVAVRLLSATRGQADIRGLGPQDHVRRGEPLSRIGRGRPGGAGCS